MDAGGNIFHGEPIVFWQQMLSPHMTGVAISLASLDIPIKCVVFQCMSEERSHEGWEPPDPKGIELLFARNNYHVESILDELPHTAIHVCEGIRGNGMVATAIRALHKKRLRWGCYLELVNDIGSFGFAKRYIYSYLFSKLQPDFILAIGKHSKEWIMDRGIHSSVVFDFAYFLQNRKVNAKPFSANDKLTIGYVGKFSRRKQVNLLVDAIANLPPSSFRLITAGSGPELSKVSKKIKKIVATDDWIHLGVVQQSSINNVMSAIDILVLPSQFDGWGATVSEALISGAHPVCSSSCGSSIVVEASGIGGVFKSRDQTDLAKLLFIEIFRIESNEVSRSDISSWASCICSDAGANYLLDILQYRYGTNKSRPVAPWDKKREVSQHCASDQLTA